MSVRFHFPLSLDDQVLIDPSTIEVTDTPLPQSPGDPPPQAMRLSFNHSLPVQIRPIIPGAMMFIGSGGNLPEIEDIPDVPDSYTGAPDAFTDAYNNWGTTGTLLVKPVDASPFDAHRNVLFVAPNRIWYFNVRLSEEFLRTTLLHHLRIGRVLTLHGAGSVPPSDTQRWRKHVIARFLRGLTKPQIQIPAASDAEEDVVAQHAMPVVEPQGGVVMIDVAAALSRDPTDGKAKRLNELSPDSQDSPRHPRNGRIPFRHVLRVMRPELVDATGPFADTVLADWPSQVRYLPLQLTRTWKPIPNICWQFPQQTLVVEDADGNERMRHPVPPHGFVFVGEEPTDQLPTDRNLEMTLEGPMRWLRGDDPGEPAWKLPGTKNPLTVLFPGAASVMPLHIILRRPMGEEITNPDVELPRVLPIMICTYYSMKYAIRAIINNRIAGGRLNHGPKVLSEVTRQLLSEAWGVPTNHELIRSLVDSGPELGVWLERPPEEDYLGHHPEIGPKLLALLEAMFPENLAAGGATYTKGKMAYYTWQTAAPVMGGAATRAYYDDNHVGRGGAGAIVALGMGRYVSDTQRQTDAGGNPTESNQEFIRRNTIEMMSGTEPGAVMQKFNEADIFEKVRVRPYAAELLVSGAIQGHSLLFVRYRHAGDDPSNPKTGFWGMDDNRGPENNEERHYPRKTTRDMTNPPPADFAMRDAEIYVAANWTE